MYLITRGIAFFDLYFSDEVSLFEIIDSDAQCLRLILHVRHFHERSPFL